MSRVILRSATALTVAAAASIPAMLTAPAVSASPAPASAYAIIGTIATANTVDQLAIDMDDDTVYASSYGSSVLFTIAPGTTTGSTASSLSLAGRPAGLAVDDDDDSVYIREGFNGRRIWVSPAGGAIARTIPTVMMLSSIAVDSADDTVYGTRGFQFGNDALDIINGRNPDDSVVVTGLGWGTYGVGVDQDDDTLWVAGLDSMSVRTMNGTTRQVVNVPGIYPGARDLAVSSSDDLAYVSTTVSSSATLQKVSQAGSLASWSDARITGNIMSISLNASGTRAVFSTGNNDDSLWVVDTATMQVDGAPLNTPSIGDTAQASSGLIYVAPYGGSGVLVVAKVQGTMNASSASAGDALTISVSPTPSTAAGQTVAVDDSTISSVSFGAYSAPVTRTGVNEFTVTAPSGPTGQVEAVATLAGGATLSLGNVDFGSAPQPAPAPIPATAPQDVTAVAGDGSVAVSWAAPASSGSYPVSHYQVVSSPGGRTCLTTSLTCTVDGLSNGTAYTFTVRALTGGGWSSASAASSAVVPHADADPTITITGTREGKRIVIVGTTTGMGMGALVTPWATRGDRAAGAGRSVEVSVDGTFRWSRAASARSTWSVYVTAADGIRSNTVTFRAR